MARKFSSHRFSVWRKQMCKQMDTTDSKGLEQVYERTDVPGRYKLEDGQRTWCCSSG